MFSITLSIATILIFTLIYKLYQYKDYLIHRYHVWLNLKKLNGPPAINRLFGNIHHYQASPENIWKRKEKFRLEYYPMYTIWSLGIGAAVLLKPEDLELVMTNPKHNSKSIVYSLINSWIGDGLLVSAGHKWHQRRKMLSPAFHFSILRQFFNIFTSGTEQLINDFKKECHKPYVEVDEVITKYTLKTITETAMGIELDFRSKTHSQYKESILNYIEIQVYRLFRPWLIIKELFKLTSQYKKEMKLLDLLHNFTNTIIKEREKNFQEITLAKEDNDDNIYFKKRLAMLDMLLSIKKNEGIIDDKGIREEVDTFTFEGHDTTASAITFILMLIATHKDIQEKIYMEMEEVMDNVKDKLTIEQAMNMNFLERCIKECLRLYPPVHFMARHLGEDLVTTDGVKLLKDTIVIILTYDTHRAPEVWPNPSKFDPDRFLPENCKTRHPFAFLPFSAGPRNCIGSRFAMLELKVAVTAVLANFKLEPVDTPENIVLVADIILRADRPIRIKFVPRE